MILKLIREMIINVTVVFQNLTARGRNEARDQISIVQSQKSKIVELSELQTDIRKCD